MAETEAEAVADIVRKAESLPRVVTVKSPDGKRSAELLITLDAQGAHEVHGVKGDLDEYLTAPERRMGTAILADLDSFIAHTKRFADADSVLFADPTRTDPSLTAVLDYHRAGADAAPRFGQHRSLYKFPLSDQWKEWTAKNGSGNAFGQGPFAEFIENRILDIIDPSTASDSVKTFVRAIGGTLAGPSKLMELSRGLSIRVGAKLNQAVNLGTGEAQFTFVSEHQDETGAPLKVPGAFVIAIPVFRGDAPYQIPVRLRYRVREGGSTVMWYYEMARVDESFDDAFRIAVNRAAKETNLPALTGKPE